MLGSTKPVQVEDIPKLISKLQDVLCVYHWRINYQVVNDNLLGKSLMVIRPNRDRNLATIYIKQSLIGLPTNEFGPLILHELLHLCLEPIMEEHAFQLEYEVPEERFREYQRRLLRCLEKTVEHLSTNISKLVTINDESATRELNEGLKVVKDDLAHLDAELSYGISTSTIESMVDHNAMLIVPMEDTASIDETAA